MGTEGVAEWLAGSNQAIYCRTMTTYQFRQLGSNGPAVFPLGLGCMGMSDFYGPADENESIATIRSALDAGITLLDTGDYYAAGHNELLIGRALRGRRDKAVLSVKFGALRGPDGSWIGMDTRPVAAKNFLGYSLKRLGVDYIDIYRPGRLDSNVPIEETVGAISELVKAGYVRAIGLSEVGPDTIRRAHTVHPISDLQIEYSLVSRGPEMRILPLLSELGIGVTAYGVLSRGLLSGSRPQSARDFRAHLPRFTGENLQQNERLAETLRQLAVEKGATASQLAIAWVLAKGSAIVPLIGARTRTQLAESLGALRIPLTPSDLKRIEAALPPTAVAGTRYDAHQMHVLDSEREGTST
jgi:aryl-alcohol dehydrogenase-like predicted oxidoreductase